MAAPGVGDPIVQLAGHRGGGGILIAGVEARQRLRRPQQLGADVAAADFRRVPRLLDRIVDIAVAAQRFGGDAESQLVFDDRAGNHAGQQRLAVFVLVTRTRGAFPVEAGIPGLDHDRAATAEQMAAGPVDDPEAQREQQRRWWLASVERAEADPLNPLPAFAANWCRAISHCICRARRSSRSGSAPKTIRRNASPPLNGIASCSATGAGSGSIRPATRTPRVLWSCCWTANTGPPICRSIRRWKR